MVGLIPKPLFLLCIELQLLIKICHEFSFFLHELYLEIGAGMDLGRTHTHTHTHAHTRTHRPILISP